MDVHLRQGVTFRDGTPFNAHAVFFNFERWFELTRSERERLATGSTASAAGSTRSKARPPRGQPLQKLRGRRRRDRHARPGPRPSATFALRSRYRASRSSARPRSKSSEPTRARSTRTGSSIRRARTRPSIPRARAVQVRVVDARRAARARSGRRLLGRSRPAREDHLRPIGDNVRLRARTDGPGLRPRRAAGHRDGHERLEPPASRAPAVQRRLRHLQPGVAAHGQARGAAGGSRDQPPGRLRLVLRRARRTVATQFMPQVLFGWADDVVQYDWTEKMEAALSSRAGPGTLPVKLTSGSDRCPPDYMPDPKRNFEAMVADLEKAASRSSRIAPRGGRTRWCRQRGNAGPPEPDRLDRGLRPIRTRDASSAPSSRRTTAVGFDNPRSATSTSSRWT